MNWLHSDPSFRIRERLLITKTGKYRLKKSIFLIIERVNQYTKYRRLCYFLAFRIRRTLMNRRLIQLIYITSKECRK